MVDLHCGAVSADGLPVLHDALPEVDGLARIGVMQCPGLHLAIGVHDWIGQVTVEYVVAGGSVSAKLVAVLPVPEILGAIVALRMGCFGREVPGGCDGFGHAHGACCGSRQSARSHIRVRGILFSGVPRGGQTVFDLAFDFRQVRFFQPQADVCFLHGVFARKYLTDAGYCRQPELWGDRGPYSGLDDDDDGYEHDGQAAKDAGDGYAGLVFSRCHDGFLF